MRTLDEQNTKSFSLIARARTNTKLMLRILRLVAAYFTTGATIRRSYRAKARSGDTYYVDQ